MIRRHAEAEQIEIAHCHDGAGSLLCRSLHKEQESTHGILFFHHDVIPAGSSIGEHLHSGTEEIYYLLKGSCILIYNGREIPMQEGDYSLVSDGDTHGILKHRNIRCRINCGRRQINYTGHNLFLYSAVI